MKALGWTLALSLLAVLLAAVLRYSPGYVLVMVPPYRLELSVGLALVGLAGMFAIGYLLLRAGSRLAGLPGEVRAWRARGQRERGEAALAAAMRAYLGGQHGRARENAEVAFAEGAAPAVSSMIAARAAHELRRFDARDRHIAQASLHDQDDPTARLMTQARWLADDDCAGEALTLLATLPAQHTAALRLELVLHQRLGQWDEARALIDRLAERDAFPDGEREALERFVASESFKQQAVDAASALDAWQQLPKRFRIDRGVALTAVQVLAAHGETGALRQIIEGALEHEWNSALVLHYSDPPAEVGGGIDSDSAQRIARCERWLEAHPGDAMLLLTLGRLCAQSSMWTRAQGYLEASLSVEPSHNAHLALAQLHAALNHHEASARHREQALALALRALEAATGGRRRLAL
jgi:HemY protein